ncbi:MAG TPA: hypothetical protein VH186_29025 [Chloroflexia bacterium]|nr:hypothetical protein [Chloroflexia bacterium]
MLLTTQNLQVHTAVASLVSWLATMRGPGGYGGPVAHWWQQCLLYTGPGLDWRYEGIITGYLNLWERTGDERWLRKAQEAGTDLLEGQLDNGHFAASAFELNPATAGTPHEAACDLALLRLALALRLRGDAAWEAYAACARRNLEQFYLQELWDPAAQSFRDDPAVPSFVPNKAATACEALFLLAEISGDSESVEKYALPNLAKILAHQASGRANPALAGAVAQNSFGSRTIEKYFPLYNARCVPALLAGYRFTGDARYRESAHAIMRFIQYWLEPDGALPAVIYANGRASSGPQWIAPLGDILRAAAELADSSLAAAFEPLQRRLLLGQSTSGGIRTASGFASQAGRTAPSLPDLRDVLPVVGWCDKAFRYLTALVEPGATFEPAASLPVELECTFQGRVMRLLETPEQLELRYQKDHRVCYRWHKGQPWAEIAAPEFWLK